MSNAKVSLFLSNPGNRALVFCLSLTAAIIVTGPSAASWMSARQERIEAEQTSQKLAELQQIVGELQQQQLTSEETAAQLRAMTVRQEDAETFRDELTELVRSSDCRLRSLTPDDRSERRWMEGDSILSDGSEFDSLDFEPEQTPYSLQTQNLELVVTGSFENICSLINAVQGLKRFVHTNAMDIHAGAESDLRLHWELTLISLVHTPAEEDNWDDEFHE